MSNLDTGSKSFDLATFSIESGFITQNDAKNILEALKKPNGKKAWERLDQKFSQKNNLKMDSNAERIQKILGVTPADGILRDSTIRALEAFAKTGKVERTSYTASKKPGIIVNEGTKKFDTLNIDALQAVKLLAEFPSDENSKPTKKARENWRKYSYDQRIALQKALGTTSEGKIGILTISALQAKAKNETYIGDVEMRKVVLAHLSAETSNKATGAEATPVVKTGAEATPVVKTGAEATPVVKTGAEATPVVKTGAEATPVVKTGAEATPVVKTGAEATPVVKTGAEATPVVKTGAEATPVVKTGAEATPVVKTGAEATPVVKTGAEATPVVKTGAEATPVVKTGAEATPVVKTGAEATPVVKTGAEATPVVKTGAEATPVVTEVGQAVSRLEKSYQNEINSLKTEFDPSKYTYVSFTIEEKEKGKINKAYRIDTKALTEAGISDVTKENSFMLMHMVTRGARVMPKYFKDIDTISTNAIPSNLRGLARIDYANTLLKSQGTEIKPNILSDVNGFATGLTKTLSLGLGDFIPGIRNIGKESVDTDERKSEMRKIEKELKSQNAKIFETNNRNNLGEYYVNILLNAKSFDEIKVQAKTDPVLQEIVAKFLTALKINPSVSDDKTDAMAALVLGDPLKQIQENIRKLGRDKAGEIVGGFIDGKSTPGFIVRNTNFLFDDATLQSVTSQDRGSILKGSMEDGKEIYLSAQKLNFASAELSYKGTDGRELKFSNDNISQFAGQTIDLGMQKSNARPEVQAMMQNTKIHIDQQGNAYLITSPKYINTLSQMMSRTGDVLGSNGAKEVYKIVGTVLLTLKLAGNHIGAPNIGTPNLPSIDVSSPNLHTPDLSSLDTALSGALIASAILNRKIALLEGEQRKTNNEKPANDILRKIAAKEGAVTQATLTTDIAESH